MFSDLIRTIIPVLMIAGALLFYSWVRSQIVNIGYETQSLVADEESLLQTKKRLMLEQETLSNPERIDLKARIELGMIPLRPNQFILPQTQDVERSLPNAMAMADSDASAVKMASSRVTSIIPGD